MKVSLNWIRDYVDINCGIREYTEKMTMTGTKVENYEVLGENIKNVVAGKILETLSHPDSDHLTICKVDAGEILQIVTGAANIKAGDMIPVCKNGAVLPDGKKIKSGKLRGVLSEGMLCSVSELDLTLHDIPYAVEDGILILQEDCKPGQDIREVLMLDDTVVDFELTFNRPDCLAFTAIARESAAALGVPFKYSEPALPEGSDPAGSGNINDYLSVEIKNSELCPRYAAKAVKNVKIQPSPLWLRMRLRACGIRPINNIVDITNYVMLEYGQPMHAFDYEYIKSKKIIVRNALDGEKITTLDGAERTLDSSMLCIADGERTIALAGIMGGENSEITNKTKTVIFESANFNRSNVRRTSQKTGLRTESSRRFEKGLPPYNAMLALNRACELVKQLGAGEIVEGGIDVCSANLDPTQVPLNVGQINKLLGTNLSYAETAALLKRVELIAEGETLTVPPYRNDILETADIAEEVARLYGYDKIESTAFKGESRMGSLTPYQKFQNELRSVCTGLGFYEAYTFSFVSPKTFDKILLPSESPLRDAIKINNPLGEDTSIMRTAVLPSVLEVLRHNHNRGAETCMIYECGTVYPKKDGLSDESKKLCLAFYGSGDFYDIKGYTQAVLNCLAVENYKIESECENPSYHPGRCAVVKIGGKIVGTLGQVHPRAAENYDMSCEVYAAELDIESLFTARIAEKRYVPLPQYPAIERDLALVMDENTETGGVCEAIVEIAGKSLCGIAVFDVYRGKGVAEGKKSVAFRLKFRLADRTLSDDEAEQSVAKILKKLDEKLGIVLRS